MGATATKPVDEQPEEWRPMTYAEEGTRAAQPTPEKKPEQVCTPGFTTGFVLFTAFFFGLLQIVIYYVYCFNNTHIPSDTTFGITASYGTAILVTGWAMLVYGIIVVLYKLYSLIWNIDEKLDEVTCSFMVFSFLRLGLIAVVIFFGVVMADYYYLNVNNGLVYTLSTHSVLWAYGLAVASFQLLVVIVLIILMFARRCDVLWWLMVQAVK
jgi:hypothetical protein